MYWKYCACISFSLLQMMKSLSLLALVAGAIAQKPARWVFHEKHCQRHNFEKSTYQTWQIHVEKSVSQFWPARWVFHEKHCQRHNGPKALSTLTHLTPLVQNRSFNKLGNLGQTSGLVLKYFNMKQLWEIHFSNLTNPFNNLEKSVSQFWQIYINIYRNPCINFD